MLLWSMFSALLIDKKISEKAFFRETTFPPDAPRSLARRNPLGLTKSSWSRARKAAKLFPYKQRDRHELREEDKARRVQMCQFLVSKDEEFFKNLVMSDEAR